MSLVIADAFEQAALNGGLATLNSGQLRFTSGDNGTGSELALLTFQPTAFAPATGNPATAAATSPIIKDSSITVGLILGVDLRTSAGISRINGTVRKGVGGDFNVTENQIPASAIEVNCDALNVTLALS